MTRGVLILVALLLAGCGKSEKDAPKTPIDVCNRLLAQAVVASCESVDTSAHPGPVKPLARVKASFAGSAAALEIFSFASKEEGDKYMAARDLVNKRVQEVGEARARAAGAHQKNWTFNVYKSKSGTLFAEARNPPEAQVAEQLTRIKAVAESVP